jgi:hypothetical protein
MGNEYSNKRHDNPDSDFVIQSLSILILLIVATAGLLHLFHDQSDLFTVHVAIAAIFAMSGLLIKKVPAAKYAFVIAGSVTWYGLLYSFVSSESQAGWQYYIRPEILIAFLSFSMALLTIPETAALKSLMSHPLLNSTGLLLLLTYFWVVELYFVNQSHEFFLDSVMNKAPLRLDDIELFSDHRITYSVILASSHYCNVAFFWILTGQQEDAIISSDSEGEEKEIVQKLKNEIRQKINNRKSRKTTFQFTPTDSQSTESSGLNSIADTQPDMEENSFNQTRNSDIKTEKNLYLAAELPEDCLEISYDDAVQLTGDGVGVGDGDNGTDSYEDTEGRAGTV